MRTLPRTLVVLSLITLATPAWAGLFNRLPRVKNGEVTLKTGFPERTVNTYAERPAEMRTQSRVYEALTRQAILKKLVGKHLINRAGKPIGPDDIHLINTHFSSDDHDGGSWTAADQRASAIEKVVLDAIRWEKQPHWDTVRTDVLHKLSQQRIGGAEEEVASLLRREQNKRRPDYIPPGGLRHDYSFTIELGKDGEPGRVAYRVHGLASAPSIQPWLGRNVNADEISIGVRHTSTENYTR